MSKILEDELSKGCTHWTRTAYDCYKLGCNCSKCYLPDILETRCLMKHTVIKLVKLLGKPPEKVLRGYKIDEI